MGIRNKDKPEETSLQDADAVKMQQNSSNNDKHFILSTLATYVKEKIGNATTILAGLMSAEDKTKIDAYPEPGTANKNIQTDGAGLIVLAPLAAGGDMLKSVYDTGGVDGHVDDADQATKIAGSPANDTLYENDSGGTQKFTFKSSITVGLAANVAGAPGARKIYGLNASNTKGFHSFEDIVNVLFPRIDVVALFASISAKSAIVLIDDDTAGGAVTVELPAAASSNGLLYKIIKTGSTAAATIDANLAETINGVATKSLVAQYDSVTIYCNGIEWFILD